MGLLDFISDPLSDALAPVTQPVYQSFEEQGVPPDQLPVLLTLIAIPLLLCFVRFCCFCCCNCKKNAHLPQPSRHEDHRSVTDRCGYSCFVLFLGLFWVMMFWAGFYGRPLRLVHGVDYEGNVCGVDSVDSSREVAGNVSAKPFMYWCGVEDQDHPWENDGRNLPGKLNFHAKSCVEACPTAANPVTIACLQRNQFEESRHNLADLTRFELTVDQTIVEQTSYPTVASNRVCLPDGDDNLQYQILTNALGSGRSSGRRISSILNGTGVLFVSGLCAVLINYMFLWALAKFAGLVLFFQMVSTVAMTIVVGVYFMMALGFWDNNLDGFYQKVNPWYHTFPDSGVLAVLCSTFTGVFFIVVALGITLATFSEASHVDETVGLVAAAMDCVWYSDKANGGKGPQKIGGLWGLFAPGGKPSIGKGTGDLLKLPLVISVMLMTCSALLLYGVTFVLSIASTDASMISYNGEAIIGLYRRLEFAWYTDYLLWFYIFMAGWILEFCMSLGQFVAAYCAVSWYYLETHVEKPTEKMSDWGGKQQQVRVVGVDAITDKRQAFVTTDDNTGHKVMHMYVGKKGPGAKDVIPTPAQIWYKDTTQQSFMWPGFATALYYHAGSLAKGSLCIGLTRPVRILPNVITSVMVREGANRQTHPLLGKSDRCCNIFGFLATCIDALIGYFSKDAYVEMILEPEHPPGAPHPPFTPGFWFAAEEIQEKVIQAGGAVAFFMGACALFDFIWAVFMFCLSFLLTLIICASVEDFTDPTSVQFVADPGCLAVVSAILNTMIGYSFIMVVSHVSDTLVYTFADQRKRESSGPHADPKNIFKYLPLSLKHLVGDELKAPEADFKPEGTRAGHFWHHGTHMFTHAAGIGGHGHGGGHH